MAVAVACFRAGINNEASVAITAITTSNSIKLKLQVLEDFDVLHFLRFMP
jgi:hypothetical protein